MRGQAMMRLRYRGPQSSVDVALPDDRWLRAPSGGVIEVTNDIGTALLAQADNWREVVPKPPKKPKADAS